MIVSFEINNIEDLNLMLQLAKRLGITQIENSSVKAKIENDNTTEINDEINDIFGNDNSDLYL
ncbi:MAG: hypothetical protein AB8G11_10190 [Saprospiraceae bacterium]